MTHLIMHNLHEISEMLVLLLCIFLCYLNKKDSKPEDIFECASFMRNE